MSNKYLLAIDPVALLGDEQFAKLSKHHKYDANTTTGEAADDIKAELQKRFEFADVFQATDETHKINAHEFLMADKTGNRGMHDIGTMETPTELLAFVTVTEEWLEQHPDEAKNSTTLKLDPRIDPKKLHANDGATKDGKTAGFIRYGDYKTPVMMLMPDGPAVYHDETVSDMERQADEREHALRSRKGKFLQVHEAFKQAKHGSSIDAFIIGWRLMEDMKNGTSTVNDYKQTGKPAQHNMPESPANTNNQMQNKEELFRWEKLQEQELHL